MKRFWLGVVCGFGGTLALLSLWAAWSMHLVHQRMDQAAARPASEEAARMRPLLDPPELPEGWEDPGALNHGVMSYDWSLENLDGDLISASRFENQVVLFDLWATWCGPCIAEMPSFAALRAAIPEDRRIALALITDEDREPVRRTIEEFPELGDLPIYFARSGIPGVIWATGRPAAFVVDCQGRVVYRHVGAADWGAEEVVDFLESLEQLTCEAAP